MEHVLDGNAAAGALSEIFAVDMTTAMVSCRACGDRVPIGELDAFMNGPGIVLRCPSCHEAEIRLVTESRRSWLDLSGVSVLEVRDVL